MDTLEFQDPTDIRAFVQKHYPNKLGEVAFMHILSKNELDVLKSDDDRIRNERYRLGETEPEEGLLSYPRIDTSD